MAVVELKSVEAPGNEKVTLICESEISILATVQHNSIFGNDVESECTAPVVLSIQKDRRGEMTATCVDHPEKKLEVSATLILLALGKLAVRTREPGSIPEYLIAIDDKAIEGLSRHYGIKEETVRALALSPSFRGNLLALYDYLEPKKKKSYPWLNGDMKNLP